MKSSVAPSISNFGCGRCALFVLVYDGILGMVGERACIPLMPNAFRASDLLCCWGCMLLAGRSCLGSGRVAVTGKLLGDTDAGCDVVPVRGVRPCGLLGKVLARVGKA